MGMIINKSRKS